MKLFTPDLSKFFPFLLLFLFGSGTLSAQVTPLVDATECYLVGDGGVFVDPADPDATNPDQAGGISSGYANCNCVTTTTLCAVDGSAVTITFTDFEVNESFDWLVILDGDNVNDTEYPLSILDDPTNVDLQLFNNADGVGDGGSENYGPGAQQDQGAMDELAEFTYSATNPTGCMTFVFRASGVVNEAGWVADITTAGGAGHPGDDLDCDANVNCLPPGGITQPVIGTNFTDITFNPVANAQGYTIIYGPTGFPAGGGTEEDFTGTSFTIDGLSQNTTYDFYLQTDCGATDGESALVGPITFTTAVSCPNPSDFIVEDTFALTADFAWMPGDTAGTYFVEVDTTGFVQGTGNFIGSGNGSTATVSGLTELTEYEAYLYLVCENGDTSNVLGPIPFVTLLAVDVGVSGILGPQSGCELGVDAPTIVLQNFGANPQSLINFFYSVNGVPVGIPVPVDGLFTGVLGKDSIFILDFETEFDFSAPGVYEIAAWTEFDGDSDITNDTFYYVFENRPLIADFPYFEDFETGNNGWRVSDESLNASWAFGTPSDNPIGAASGVNAWQTNLTGDYNNNELSYLESTCLDFTSLTEDPFITFSIFFDGEACCDEGWLEMSVDGGETFTKVGTAGTGINWYNDDFNQWWDGTAGFDGWAYAQNELTGSAGFDDVRLRFAFSSDFSVTDPGFGVDNILISAPAQEDLAAASVSNASTGGNCGSTMDMVTLNIVNLGQDALTGFNAAYQVNGGPVVAENIPPLTLNPGETTSYTFTQTFDSSPIGTYTIRAWTVFPDDVALNDTTTFTFSFDAVLPIIADFEDGELPAGFTTDEPFGVQNGHNLPSFAISDNNFSGDPNFFLETPLVGPLNDGDSLTFDYRYVDWFAGTDSTILAGDSLTVGISVDCGMTYDQVVVINQDNHVPTTAYTNVTVDLSAYAGQAVIVRFENNWAAGDYWFDLDNINILACPESLDLTATSTPADTPAAPNGSASVNVGNQFGPFDYLWSTGDTTAVVEELLSGDYTVTVTNGIGCTDTIAVTVDFLTSTQELTGLNNFRLYPNPTAGTATLEVAFDRPRDVQVQVLSSVGQLIARFELNNGTTFQETLDLNHQAAGVYYVRLVGEEGTETRKLVLTR